MEAKEGEAKADASLLSEVARYFKDQAFMCSKDEGLEVVFDDFVSEHARVPSGTPVSGSSGVMPSSLGWR